MEKLLRHFCSTNGGQKFVSFFDSFLFSCTKQNCTNPVAVFACANEAIKHESVLCLVKPDGHCLLVMDNLLTQHCYAIDSLLQIIKKLSGIFSNILKIISSCYVIAGSEIDVTKWTFRVCRLSWLKRRFCFQKFYNSSTNKF